MCSTGGIKDLGARRCTRTYLINLGVGQHCRERARERATRPERAVEAASEGACRGVRGAKPLG